MVPAYSCPAANAVRDAFQAVPAWTTHLQTNTSLKARLDEVFGTAGLDAWASWCERDFQGIRLEWTPYSLLLLTFFGGFC
jgi:hypothetical protein